jgi:hypothetical protein
VAATAAVVLFVPMYALRAYQQPHVRALLDDYAHAPMADVPVQRVTIGDRVSATLPTLWTSDYVPAVAGEPFGTQFLMAEFSPARCGALTLPVTLRYTSKLVVTDFSRSLTVNLWDQSQPVRILFSAFLYQGSSSLTSVDLPAPDASCLVSVRRFTDLARYPLALSATYSPGWESSRLYLQREPATDAQASPYSQVVSFPPDRGLRADHLRFARHQPLGSARYLAPLVHPEGAGFAISGEAESTSAYVIMFDKRTVAWPATLVAEGEVRHGGLTIGALDAHGAWAGSVNVTRPGRFIAVVAIPTQEFQPIVANDIEAPSIFDSTPRLAKLLRGLRLLAPSTDVRIDRIGVLLEEPTR